MSRKKSQMFRCFVAGATISDGRTITPQMIDETVATFNLATYTPRCNVEHIRGFSPEAPFNGYGDVVAVEARDDEIVVAGKTEKRRALYAQVEANDQLVALGKTDQKPFPSVELTDNYAGTGKVGLVGLAFTDSPASIATQRLSFSRSAPGTVHAQGEDAVTFGFAAEPATGDKVESAVAGFFTALAAKFGKTDAQPPATPTPPPPPANDNAFDPAAFATALGETVGKSIGAAIAPVTADLTKLQGDFATLKTKLETTEQLGFSRTTASGGGTSVATDC